ncbi:hypothetical protein B0O99DRAFT_163233 [Bisporella sp. PMI_857]|nr:hypothetical protein B0O99DRAFT_163233 [Bisporella sp. PMI_857]
MSSWMNDTAVQNHNGAGFTSNGNMVDPSAFMANNFDPSQFQNNQLQQRMQNGAAMRNGSPAFNNNPVYQTNSVIPSKRPREASLGTSPRQAPTMLPNSRSQTPQQTPYPGYQQNNAAPQQTPYTHLQNGSTNGSPSPIMNNPLVRPGGVPQRVSTASPHPFSPAGQQQFAPQPSPSQSEHGSRIDTPQNPYAQNPGFAQGFSQTFTPPSGRSSVPPQNPVTPQLQQMQQNQMFSQQQAAQQAQQQRATAEQQKMMYQMKLQQTLQQQNAMAQRQGMPQNASPMAKGPAQGPNGQMMGIQPQAPAQSRGPNPEQFVKSLRSFMQQKGLQLDENPMVEGRQVPIISLYLAVLRFGGFKKVTQANGWSQVALTMHFPPPQVPSVAQILKGLYERYLVMFEEAWQQNQQRQRMAVMQNQQQQQQQQQAARNMAMGGQMSPTKQMMPQNAMQQPHQYAQQQQMLAQQLAQSQTGNSAKIMTPAQQPAINGFSTPLPPQTHPQHPSHARNSLSRSTESGPQNGGSFAMPSPVTSTKGGSLSMPSPQVDTKPAVPPVPQEFNLSDEFNPRVRVLDTFGGVELESLNRLGLQLAMARPDVPPLHDLGTIDIHALTMSLQSGIPAEVRLALDHLTILSADARTPLDLKWCEDLVDTLIDCAEEQIEALAENAAEVSDVMLINPYEDVLRYCRNEQEMLQDIPTFASPEYELDRAVERLICITTLMRNLSFYEPNHNFLADETVIKFLCVIIRHLGTRNMLLRSHRNTLDFMKDVIIFLSNLAQAIELPGREQALCLLHFLLAFAPCPSPNFASGDRISFSSYDPAVHRYLPPALDSLAKLLARDEPNRSHYKTIFASDASSSPPYDLLTRSFGLAISPIPDEKQDTKRGNLGLLVEARKPILMQGMLAAEILSHLAPGFDAGLAMSWLTSEDGFAQNLFRMVLSLTLDVPPQLPHSRSQTSAKGFDDEALLRIAMDGLAVLHRLAEKSRGTDSVKPKLPATAMPTKETLLAALEIKHPRYQGVLKRLCVYAGLDN